MKLSESKLKINKQIDTEDTSDKMFSKIYPKFRYPMRAMRGSYIGMKNMTSAKLEMPETSNIIPDSYEVCNTNTIDGEFPLNVIEGEVPKDLGGNMYICQCLGTPEAFMVGDTNIVKINFNEGDVNLRNRLMWNPVAIARMALRNTRYKFDHMGLMFMSPGLGMFSYTEGMYLLPDGRLGITSDVDRPWIIDRENLKATSPVGRRDEWLPMMAGQAGDVMGNLFAGYSNSHAIYTDTNTKELFLINYQYDQADGSHPCHLIKWDGKEDFKTWSVVDENGEDIQIMQSIHELIFTRDYILLADTAFATGAEILSPWKNAPLPMQKTVVFIVDRRDMVEGTTSVVARKVETGEACIHLIADYENPDDVITTYMLHTQATNTAEIIRSYDKDLEGKRFPEHLVGYGTLPVLDVSSIGRHVIDMKTVSVVSSDYVRDEKYTWGPYMYTYMGRQMREFVEQDLFVMFKGFKKEMLPQRIYEEYKDVDNRIIPLTEMFSVKNEGSNNSIARLDKKKLEIADLYEFPDKVLLYTISCMESNDENHGGYVLAAVLRDVEENNETSGHEYWIFEADNLAAGPICKMGNKELNNSTVFHTVYITDAHEKLLDEREVTYNVPIREDYKPEELERWGKPVIDTFEKVIYKYYEEDEKKTEKTLKKYSKKRVMQHAGKEHLIGEEKIDSRDSAVAMAERMFTEANRMFSTTGWKTEYEKNGLLVESKPIKGVLEKSGVLVTRAEQVIEAEADKLFEYLCTPEGYAVIDPVSDPEDHEKEPLAVYEWKDGARLEAAVATTEMPMMAPTDFVVLNAIDPSVRMFASKSILHDTMPGGSKYTVLGKSEDGRERALNTFVVKVEKINANKCRVLCINYADMCGITAAGMNNMINCKAFFPPLYKRMVKAVEKL